MYLQNLDKDLFITNQVFYHFFIDTLIIQNQKQKNYYELHKTLTLLRKYKTIINTYDTPIFLPLYVLQEGIKYLMVWLGIGSSGKPKSINWALHTFSSIFNYSEHPV